MTDATRPAKKKTAAEALITGAAAVAALILLNVLSCQSRAKLDLTKNKVYSLTPASKGIVANMPERVNVKAYFGGVPAEYAEKQTYVDMLLQEYADASGSKIVYERTDVDLSKDPKVKDELRQEGIGEIRLLTRRDDIEQSLPMYFHVVFSHLDKKEMWTPEQGFTLEGLEWDFTTRIKRLAYGKKKVGLTTGYGEPQQAQVLTQGLPQYRLGQLGLNDLYDVTPISWDKEPHKIADVDVLIVNGPTEKVSDAALYQLDQYIMKGKPVLFLVSGMKWQGAGNQGMPFDEGPQPFVGMPSDNGVAPLLKAYGFEVGQDAIIDPRNTGLMVVPPGNPRGMRVIGFAPVARSEQAGQRQMLEGIDAVLVPFASTMKLVGPLEKPGEDIQVIPLLKTVDTSWARKEIVAISPQMKLETPKNERGPYLVAVAVKGKIKSYFADKPVPAGATALPSAPAPEPEQPTDGLDQGEADQPAPTAAPPAAAPAEPAGPVKESPSGTRIIVVSAPAIVADTSLVDYAYVNGWVAAHSMVDWLAEDQDLAAARAKTIARPINRLEPATRTVVKMANVVGAPLLLIIFGIIYWRVRESRRRGIQL